MKTINWQPDWAAQEMQRATHPRAGSLDAGVNYSSLQALTVQLAVDFQLE